MKKNRSLRSMIFFLAVVLIIPILCFTLYLQVQTWRTMKHNLQRELEGELNTANHTLEMVIDKYDMVLYDFCTNDEIIELVEQINESEKPSDAVKYQIRRSLAHICNRNVGVEGITLITESGTVCFYDKEAASFVSTKWANKIPKVNMQDQMAVYQGSSYVLGTERQPVCRIDRCGQCFPEIHQIYPGRGFGPGRRYLQENLRGLDRYLEEKLEGAALTLLDQPDPAVQQYERKELDRLRDDHRCDGHSLFRKCGGLLPGLLGFRLYEAGTAAARIWNVRARYG